MLLGQKKVQLKNIDNLKLTYATSLHILNNKINNTVYKKFFLKL